MYRALLWCCICLSISFLAYSTGIVSLKQGRADRIVGGEFTFANWRGGIACDYSTNPAVADYYNGGHSTGMREDEYIPFLRRLHRGDTLIVGMDYYAVTFSGRYFPPLLEEERGWLLDGRVYYFRVYAVDNQIMYDQITGRQ